MLNMRSPGSTLIGAQCWTPIHDAQWRSQLALDDDTTSVEYAGVHHGRAGREHSAPGLVELVDCQLANFVTIAHRCTGHISHSFITRFSADHHDPR